MSYTFIADAEKLENLHTAIVNGATAVGTALDNIFNLYDSMGSSGHWTGTNYETFISQVQAKKADMYKSKAAFEAFAEQVAQAQTDASTMFSEIGI